MLSTLIESRRRRSRNTGGTVASVLAHAIAITLVAAVTAHASDDTPAAQATHPEIVYVKTPEPAPSHERSSPAQLQTPRERTIPVLPQRYIEVSTIIPTRIPTMDLSLSPIDQTQLSIGGATNSGTVGTSGLTPRGSSGTYTASEVEQGTVPLPGNPKPKYPSMLQSARVNGEVLAQFVVDTTGRIDMSTFRAVQATDDLFVQSVRRALAEWEFRPAEVSGAKVRQLVQMPLTFKVR